MAKLPSMKMAEAVASRRSPTSVPKVMILLLESGPLLYSRKGSGCGPAVCCHSSGSVKSERRGTGGVLRW